LAKLASPDTNKREDIEQEQVPVTFATKVAEVTGVHPRTANRLIKAATTLTDQQLRGLEIVKASATTLEEISNVKDPDTRNKAIVLICSGQNVKDAIEMASGGSSEGDERSMSDADWIESHCGEIRGRLADPAPFDSSAAFYRTIKSARRDFRQKVKRDLAAVRDKNMPVGQFVRLVAKVVEVAHPSAWLVCGACQGGKIEGSCVKCFGDGFIIQTERT
jgi:hypothetical protein